MTDMQRPSENRTRFLGMSPDGEIAFPVGESTVKESAAVNWKAGSTLADALAQFSILGDQEFHVAQDRAKRCRSNQFQLR